MNITSMKCPYCLVAFHLQAYPPREIDYGSDGYWWIEYERCQDCGKTILWLTKSENRKQRRPETWVPAGEQCKMMVYPKGTNRPPVPANVPDEVAQDYLEACLVIGDSPKASAALSRRCL